MYSSDSRTALPRVMMMRLAKRIWNRLFEELAVGLARVEGVFFPYAPVSLVTAANHAYFVPLKRLLRTVYQYEAAHVERVIVYDLGFTPPQVEYLCAAYPKLLVRSFDLSNEVPWASMDQNAGGFYAWKPLIIARVLEEFGTDVIWADSSIVIRRPLLRIRKTLRRRGLYTSFWVGKSIRDATDERTISVLNAHDESRLPMLVASLVGVSRAHATVHTLVEEWVRCCIDPNINNPQGATVATHKGDQSVLSILAYRNGLVRRQLKRNDSIRLDFFIQNDRKTMFVDVEQDAN